MNEHSCTCLGEHLSTFLLGIYRGLELLGMHVGMHVVASVKIAKQVSSVVSLSRQIHFNF